MTIESGPAGPEPIGVGSAGPVTMRRGPAGPEPSSPVPAWVRRTGHHLVPDPSRVIAALFLPGQEMAAGASRSAVVMARIAALSNDEVAAALADLRTRFVGRHRDLEDRWLAHAAMVEHRLPDGRVLDEQQRLLVGAAFTQEITLEGAALCNPSMVRHPDQQGVPDGATRFVLSLRAIGEGHRSSIELRTGTIDASNVLELDPAPTVAVTPSVVRGPYERRMFRHYLDDLGGVRANADFVLSGLGESFSPEELDAALARLRRERLTRGAALHEIEHIAEAAAGSYTSTFPATSALGERVLVPVGSFESNGVEDLRLTPLVDLAGAQRFIATYTAYDGRRTRGQLLSTEDFEVFHTVPLAGPGALDKGLAIFPRAIGGRYAALSRADRESNSLAWSDDLVRWEQPTLVQRPGHSWDLIQLGNCGPPLETELGWLVLTHGVGPMRTYGIGAVLLDLEDPTRLLGSLPFPLLTAAQDERSGYVPNVVYSCGAMLHGRTIVLPYGCSDSSTRIALVDLDPLLAELQRHPQPAPGSGA